MTYIVWNNDVTQIMNKTDWPLKFLITSFWLIENFSFLKNCGKYGRKIKHINIVLNNITFHEKRRFLKSLMIVKDLIILIVYTGISYCLWNKDDKLIVCYFRCLWV